MLTRILLSGDGGQGIQLLSDIICESAFVKGKEVSHIPNYGLEQRGGVSLAFIQIGDEKIVYPKFNDADILLILSEQARERTKKFQNKEGKIDILDIKYYTDILNEKDISAVSYNIFFLGLILKKLAEKDLVDIDYAKKYLSEKLSKKPGWPDNLRAFGLGLNKSKI